MKKIGTVLVQTEPTFDEFSAEYETALNKGLNVSGEGRKYFAQARIEWLRGCLEKLEIKAKKIMDFGCGTGTSFEFFLRWPGLEKSIGVDVSNNSLSVARKLNEGTQSQFLLIDDFNPQAELDLIYCNGVFHHILPAHRSESVNYILSSLKPGGLISFWENNPWNPGTKYIMSKIPFDKEAVPLSFLEAKSLLKNGGFEIIQSDFLFIFPRSLKFLRWLEPFFCKMPIGAQYQILARKPL